MTKRGGREHFGECVHGAHCMWCCQEERGGRESGGHAGSQPDPVARGSVSAAADPAARREHIHPPGEICPGCLDTARERIRTLEDAERTCKRANESQRRSIEALEAELAERDKVLATYQRWAMDAGRTSLAARAEKAEAELQRLADEGLTIEERDARVVELKAELAERKKLRGYLTATEKALTQAQAEVERLKALIRKAKIKKAVEREGGT